MHQLNINQKIIETYCALINEFFVNMNASDVMNELNQPLLSVYNGINCIHRVFEFILLKTKSIKKTYYYSQRAYSYYLEYMEQIHKANLSLNLNHIDAILFVYKKSIFDMYDEENYGSSNSITNIMTLNYDVINIDEKDLKPLFETITKTTNVLFYWENSKITFEDRIRISNEYLPLFLNKLDKIETVIEYLKIIQQKIEMGFTIYEKLLNAILKMKEKKNSRSTMTTTPNDICLLKFYVEEDIFKEKFEKGDMKEFVKWLQT
jgi:hypothetical protein